MTRVTGDQPTAGERLRTWIRTEALYHSEFAERLGISPSMVSALVCGRAHPSPELAARIERATKIPASAWAFRRDA